MKEHFDRIYFLALYSIVGALMTVNATAVISGAYIGLVPLVFQGAVIFAVARCKPWADKIVVAWSALAIISGVATLIAISLGNAESIKAVNFRMASLAFGLFFAYFAKSVFSRRSQNI